MKKNFISYTRTNKALRDAACTNHTGKMTGIISWSTSPLENARCRARAGCGNDKCICCHCYSNAMQAQYDALATKLARNTKLLTGGLLEGPQYPQINADKFPYCRLEAFGDLVNDVQAANYMAIADNNPGMMFGWWTKNIDLLVAGLEWHDLPENVTIVISNPHIDTRLDLDAIRARYPELKNARLKAFNVWASREAAQAAGVEINCAGKACLACGLCYEDNDIPEINELLRKV